MSDIVLVTVDSLRQDHVGCYGYSRNTTPFLDEFGDENHVFTNAFSQAGMTRASFPSILTSSYPNMYGGFERITEERTLISEVLNDNEYTTGGFHSNLFLAADFGYSRGFNRFYDSKDDPDSITKLRQFIKVNLSQESVLYKLLQKVYNLTEKSAGVEIGSSYVKADDITDKAIQWATNLESEKKFLWTHYMDVHHPYIPPEEYQLEFRDTPISDRHSIKLRRKMLESPEEVTKKEKQELIDLYDAEIRFTDAEIGRLIEQVKQIWGEDTLVLVTSDHGEEFSEHGRFSHSTAHDEGIHVPLMIDSGDGSGTYEEIVGLNDLAPTIADLAGCEIPENFYGYSLQSLMQGTEWERKYVISDFRGKQGVPDHFFYRDYEWKYIRSPEDERLYNLNDDPNEIYNIIGEEPPVLEEIRSKINEHEQTVLDTSCDVDEVEMDDVVKDRLEKLGYKM